ncbi:uncharacterized protein ACB058_021610 [Synchiropus picturatus]
MQNLHILLMMLSLPMAAAMAELFPPEPPTGAGRFFPGTENLAEQAVSMEAYCQRLPEDQMPWFCQCTHCKTTAGPKGERGDRGLPGTPGSPGPRGLTGFRGPPGFMGRQGIKGQKGDEGEKGSRGLQGSVGPKGARGFKGDKGEPGVEGPPGEPGPKGDEGVCPDSCQAIEGPPGQAGLPGPAGPRGLPGTQGQRGPQGSKGDAGDAGLPGEPGPEGEKGERGAQGQCDCTDGADGAPGGAGAKGEKGEAGEAGREGQAGPQGAKGEPGMMGAAGPPGPCSPVVKAAFSVGLTSSYPPPDTPVLFGHVFYNLQGGYDAATGIFRAPVNGTYVFSYHLTVYERVLVVGIFVNQLPAAITTDPNVLGVTSHTVLLHLARGDMVWVQVKSELTNGMFAGSEASSTFSGFLLHPDSCEAAAYRAPPLLEERSVPASFPWSSRPGTDLPEPPAAGSQ